MLAELRPDPGQQHREPKWLRHIVVGAGFEPQDRIGIGVVAGQHDDRSLEAALAERADHFAAVGVGQADVHQDQIGGIGFGGSGALGAGVDCGGFEFLVQRQLLDQRIAQIGIVIHDQDLAGIGHRYNPSGRGGQKRRALMAVTSARYVLR
ncbi:hypothetical protein ABIF15_004135 [Bradyrhizobium elkanii]